MSLLEKTPKEEPRNWGKMFGFICILVLVFIVLFIKPFVAVIIGFIGFSILGLGFNSRTDKKEAKEYEKKMKKEGKWR